MELDRMDFILAKKVMAQTNHLSTQELRAIAAMALSWPDDELLGVIAEGIGLPPIIDRAQFLGYINAGMPARDLARVIVGAVMLDELEKSPKKILLKHHGISERKLKREMSA